MADGLANEEIMKNNDDVRDKVINKVVYVPKRNHHGDDDCWFFFVGISLLGGSSWNRL
jgi:hypothetical protein